MKCKKALRLLCGTALAALILTAAAFAVLEARDTGTDTARAAAFALDAWIERSGLAECTLYVSGGAICETALSYSVTMILDEPLPVGVEAYLDGRKFDFDSSGTVGTVYGGAMPAGAGQNEHKLGFDTVDAAVAAEISVAVYVTAEQID